MWNDAKIHFHGKFLRRLFRCSGERNDAIPSLRRGRGESIYVYIAYIRLCPGNIEPRPFYRPELSSPPWYLFNTDATPRQPLLSYRPTCNTCPRGVSLLPRFSHRWKDIPVEIIIFNPVLSSSRIPVFES